MSGFEDDMFVGSLTHPQAIGSLSKSDFVMIEGRACKVVDMVTFKPGKHGRAKTQIVGLDIFDGKKYEHVGLAMGSVECPVVKHTVYKLMDIDENGFCSLIDDNGEVRDDLKPHDPDLEKEIRDKVENEQNALVTVQKALGKEMILSVKNMEE